MRDHPINPVPTYRRAVFLDRDGTINVDTHYPHKAEELEMIPEALEGVKMLSGLPLDMIVVSNQSGIALEMYSEEEMTGFNRELMNRLSDVGGRIDGIYYCPHPEYDGSGDGVGACQCSKPLPGLLLEAAMDFQVDLPRSYMIGDKSSDIMAGKRAGCTTILVMTGKAGKEDNAVDVKPDYVAENLLEAALIVQSLVS
jgi:D,D-heptose 1,7-bisphosphate phosphatase